MLQFQQHLFRMLFAQMTPCFLHYDVIYYPFPVNSQYLKMWGVDNPGNLNTLLLVCKKRNQNSQFSIKVRC